MSADRQVEAARRIAELFLAGASQFNDEHVDLFDRTLAPLIEGLPTAALASLTQRLAPLRNAPRDVMRGLAGDPAIAVAGPVLTRCGLLDEADLVAIARAGSQAHLFAISGRPRLAPAVTDVLVDCGDRDVVRNLAMNRGAELSRSGLAMLLARAVRDRKSTRLNSSHLGISYAVFCLKKKTKTAHQPSRTRTSPSSTTRRAVACGRSRGHG